MDLERVIAALAPRDVVGRAPLDVADLAYDTRAVTPGALFFCVRGERVDGHDLAAEAVARGAVALVVERPLDGLDVPQLVVADSRAAMAPAADEFFGRPTERLQVAGVTGTNGKTTTAYLIWSILDAAGRRPGLLGTVETRVAGNASAAIEATSHGSELRRLDRTRFAALVFTNLNQDHLDFHGTMERYYAAKRRLFADGVPAAVNVGNEWGRRLARELGGAALTYGFAPDADIRPDAL